MKKEELIADIERFAITPPTEDEMREFFRKAFEFLKDVVPNEKFDKFIDKQLEKLDNNQIDAFDVVFAFVRALFAKD